MLPIREAMPPQHDRRSGSARRLPARRRWGQHFLVSAATADRIVDAARVGEKDAVLEIGPGDGALTRPLSDRAALVAAVEIDPRRAAALELEFSGNPRVRILRGDATARPLSEWLAAAGWGATALLVANLPYNAATPILTAAIQARDTIRRSVVTVQREVARRFVARPGEEGYGYLSVRTAAHASGRILFDLPPSAFRPRPKVVSSVLELTPREEPLDARLVESALRLASLGFRARRKTLANALASAAPRDVWERRLEALGKTPRTRAEELSLEDFLALARGWTPPSP